MRSERDGAVALGADGAHYLDEDRVEGEDPLAPFGPNAADHVRRTDGFPHCPDLMVNSHLLAGRPSEVAAFEELVGSHGGMGGEPVASRSSCFPAELDVAGRTRWSAPSGCTGSSAAGSPSSGHDAYASERRLARLQHPHLDLRRQLAPSRRRTRAAGRRSRPGRSRARPSG